MSNKKIIITILILGVIFALLGILLAMNSTGVFNLKAALADLPFIGERFKTEDEMMIIKPLEEENHQLHQEIENLQLLLAEKEKEKTVINEEVQAYIDRVAALEELIIQLEQKEIKNSQLASYYSEMEDRQAVRIFDNLDDETVIGILVKLPSEKTAEFLAAMDPMRAAKLTAVLTDKTISVIN